MMSEEQHKFIIHEMEIEHYVAREEAENVAFWNGAIFGVVVTVIFFIAMMWVF